jgi:GNAT superfamily N-acetyltransferase
VDAPVTLRRSRSTAELELLEPLWGALQEHHAAVLPKLASGLPARSAAESWPRRRARYEAWLADGESFFLLAEHEGRAVGYAFVTVGPALAGWVTGRLAELETLSVLPGWRGGGVGTRLLDAVWERLAERGIEEMTITATVGNAGSHRFYERHGFEQGFVVYAGRRPGTGP